MFGDEGANALQRLFSHYRRGHRQTMGPNDTAIRSPEGMPEHVFSNVLPCAETLRRIEPHASRVRKRVDRVVNQRRDYVQLAKQIDDLVQQFGEGTARNGGYVAGKVGRALIDMAWPIDRQRKTARTLCYRLSGLTRTGRMLSKLHDVFGQGALLLFPSLTTIPCVTPCPICGLG